MKFKKFIIENFKEKYGIEQSKMGLEFSEKNQKCYGWSHRAIYGFIIGDKLFDKNLTPDVSKPSLINPSTDKLKFTERGTIKTLDQAKKAPENFSKYMS